MERRKFLSSSFLMGAAGGAAAGAAVTVALAPKFLQPAPLPGRLSYAQQGEDIALWQILRGEIGGHRRRAGAGGEAQGESDRQEALAHLASTFMARSRPASVVGNMRSFTSSFMMAMDWR